MIYSSSNAAALSVITLDSVSLLKDLQWLEFDTWMIKRNLVSQLNIIKSYSLISALWKITRGSDIALKFSNIDSSLNSAFWINYVWKASLLNIPRFTVVWIQHSEWMPWLSRREWKLWAWWTLFVGYANWKCL